MKPQLLLFFLLSMICNLLFNQVILSTCIMWLLCYILTASGALPDDDSKYGYHARTDLRLNVIQEVSWIRFPYPGK